MTRSGKVNRENLGAWLVKSNPRKGQLAERLARGENRVDRWCVRDNYRSALMQPGDLMFLWVTGGSPDLHPGIWGVGRVTDPPESPDFSVGLDLTVADAVMATREELRADPRLRGLEPLVQPQMSNPGYVSREEATVLLHLCDVRADR